MDRPLSLHVEGEGCSRVGGEASLAPGLSGGECMQAQEQYTWHGASAQPLLVLMSLQTVSEGVAAQGSAYITQCTRIV